MRQAQVRGCLPALLVLALLGALVALVITASLAVALPVAGALLVLGLARSLWYRLTGRTPPPFGAATFRTVRIDSPWGDPGRPGPGAEEGPIVDALPRGPASDAGGEGEAPAQLPGPPGQGRPGS